MSSVRKSKVVDIMDVTTTKLRVLLADHFHVLHVLKIFACLLSSPYSSKKTIELREGDDSESNTVLMTMDMSSSDI